MPTARFSTLACTAAALTAALSAAPAFGGASVPWTTPAGTTDDFAFTAGGSANGLVNTPVTGNYFLLFFPANFNAVASNDDAGSITETLYVQLVANPGTYFTDVTVHLTGDYTVLGPGVVDAGGLLTVTDIATNDAASGNMAFTPLPVMTGLPMQQLEGPGEQTQPGSAEGTFTGTTTVATGGLWESVMLKLEMNLDAAGGPGGTSQIAGKILEIEAQTAVVPLPSALLAGPLGLAAVGFARRRFAGRRAVKA
ncbi:MAG: hypothetical protein ACFCVE_07555 [Phycisphaerae bacterium]